MRTLSLAMLAMALALPAFAQSTTTQGTARRAPPSPAVTAPTATAPASTAPATKPMQAAPQGALVDINSASSSELDALPGIGKSRADAIIKNRPYSGKDDLLARHILPKNVYEGVKDKIVARKG